MIFYVCLPEMCSPVAALALSWQWIGTCLNKQRTFSSQHISNTIDCFFNLELKFIKTNKHQYQIFPARYAMSGSFKNKETRVSCYKSVFIETAAWIDTGNNNDLVLNDYRCKLAKWLILFSFQKQTTLIMLTWRDWGQRERNIDNYYIKITQMTVFLMCLFRFSLVAF